jgi:hypothetical protein
MQNRSQCIASTEWLAQEIASGWGLLVLLSKPLKTIEDNVFFPRLFCTPGEGASATTLTGQTAEWQSQQSFERVSSFCDRRTDDVI